MDYAARLTIDYPEEKRNRLTVFFRVILVIPIAVIIALVSGTGNETVVSSPEVAEWNLEEWLDVGNWDDLWRELRERNRRDDGDEWGHGKFRTRTYGGITTGLFVAAVLMILFRRKYPRWWFDFLLQLERFAARVFSYILFLTDQYPSTDEEQSVHLDVDYPEARKLKNGLPLIKWFIAIPHYVVLAVLAVVVVLITIVAWILILITGTYPRGMFEFVVGVLRWALRVRAYAFLLATDVYPPFSLK